MPMALATTTTQTKRVKAASWTMRTVMARRECPGGVTRRLAAMAEAQDKVIAVEQRQQLATAIPTLLARA